MKNILKYFSVALFLTGMASCQESEIITYDLADSAVCFKSQSSQFSLKGINGESLEVAIPLDLIGLTTDYDREVGVAFSSEGLENPAAEGVDFEFLGAEVKAGELGGEIRLKLNKFKEGESRKNMTISLVANENFRESYPAYMKANIVWSEEYVRPHQAVWHFWYLYFSKYYSRAIHEIYIEVFSEEIELYTRDMSDAEDYGLIYQGPYWWQSANRKLYEYVSDHDAAHPDAPLMHSEDWLYYDSYLRADGDGKKSQERTPTILETLIAL